MKRFIIVFMFIVSGFVMTVSGQASLIDRGGGLIYDTSLNITWYDYTYWAMSGSEDAKSWAAGLNVGGVTGWRLPQTMPVNGATYGYQAKNNGSTDIGYNISAPGSAYQGSPASELANLYYVALGNKGFYDVNGNQQAGAGLVNKGPFQNLQPDGYWSGTLFDLYPKSAWYFDFNYGIQTYFYDDNCFSALAVHDGDVAKPIPEPLTIILLCTGLLGLGFCYRRSMHNKLF